MRTPVSAGAVGALPRGLCFLWVLLAGCGHSQPEKDYGSQRGGGGPPPSPGGGARGGAAGAAGAGGASRGGPFAVSKGCKAIEARYDAAFPELLVCPVGDAVRKCDSKAYKDHIVCGCTVFTTAGNFGALGELQNALNDWNNAGCAKELSCPSVDCPAANKGACVADGDVGTCETQ